MGMMVGSCWLEFQNLHKICNDFGTLLQISSTNFSFDLLEDSGSFDVIDRTA